MQIQKRDVAVSIVLSIVTCGIYAIYWLYCLNEDTNNVSREQNPMSGGMVILLTIVTCGIFGIYWCFKQGERLDRASEMRGLPKKDRGILYLVFSIIGLSIIAYALMQDELNALCDISAGQQPPQNNNQYPPQQ